MWLRTISSIASTTPASGEIETTRAVMTSPAFMGASCGFERFLIRLTLSVSLPGLTGQSSTHGRCLLDHPFEPGDDSAEVSIYLKHIYHSKRPECRAEPDHHG